MDSIPEILTKAAKDVHSLLEQLQAFQIRYTSLEHQLRVIQNDLWAAENELAQMRKEAKDNQKPPYYLGVKPNQL